MAVGSRNMSSAGPTPKMIASTPCTLRWPGRNRLAIPSTMPRMAMGAMSDAATGMKKKAPRIA